ncbi:hypothetical protein FBY33_2090 [Arthrobacter sp. SLBN-112]|uniref:hypothetical protein n=1 Tax=Arthrobacter sp. SLBN-112 TaxID=2768452 RepID=UPI00114F7815|nr:hypothetical protein [Arthrobacter sp. SLBN-112]TQJ40048.1 hypothetical protein FBY33_2090 [Arthrobacter sp. SLBN-112]
MEFKRSAGIFGLGFALSLIGYVLGTIFAFSAASQTSRYYSSSAGALAVVAAIFFLAALIGSIMMVVGLHRAMVKIDALAVSSVVSATVAPAAAPVGTSQPS